MPTGERIKAIGHSRRYFAQANVERIKVRGCTTNGIIHSGEGQNLKDDKNADKGFFSDHGLN